MLNRAIGELTSRWMS